MKEKLLARFIVVLLKLWGATLRFKINDPANIGPSVDRDPVIFAAWHNRLFCVPIMRWKLNRKREILSMISLSKDGELLAKVLEYFKMPAIRGSSSKQARRAVLQAKEALASGKDIAITPDGPRGPCYQLQPGALFLAQQTKGRLIIFTYESSRSIRVKSWDRFMIPMPFSRVEVGLIPCEVRQTETKEEFETERLRLQNAMIEALGEK